MNAKQWLIDFFAPFINGTGEIVRVAYYLPAMVNGSVELSYDQQLALRELLPKTTEKDLFPLATFINSCHA